MYDIKSIYYDIIFVCVKDIISKVKICREIISFTLHTLRIYLFKGI